jgi:hypothetical protein
MIRKHKAAKRANGRDDGLDWLMASIFEEAYAVWKRYEGEIPQEILAELDRYWD